MQHLKRKKIKVISTVFSLLLGKNLYAGGFSLYTESTGYTIGNFAAGVAAEAFDASTAWYNPAGLALIHEQQAIVSGVGVLPTTILSGYSQYNYTESPPYLEQFANIQGTENALVPSVYYAKPLLPNLTVAASLTAPFGLASNWSPTSAVRYAGTYSKLLTIDASPEFGLRINDHLSLGAGLDLEYAEVTFNSILGLPNLGQPANLYDSKSDNHGDSFGVGFHTGLLFMLQENHTRFGLNYQSRIAHHFIGKSELKGRLADSPMFDNSDAIFSSNDLNSNDIQLPDIITFSGYHDLNDRWAMLGSVVYTGWSVFKNIELHNIAGATITDGLTEVDFISHEDYRNTWRAALGFNYKWNDKWMLRMGGGFDQTPTIDTQRTIRLPDGNRWALSAGAHFQPFAQWTMDVGYTYLQALKHITINKLAVLDENNSVYVNATGQAYASLVGVQINWLIDKPVVKNS